MLWEMFSRISWRSLHLEKKNMWLVKCRYKKVLGFCASDYRQNHDLLHHCYYTSGILLLLLAYSVTTGILRLLQLLCLLWPHLHVVTYSCCWSITAIQAYHCYSGHTTAATGILLLLQEKDAVEKDTFWYENAESSDCQMYSQRVTTKDIREPFGLSRIFLKNVSRIQFKSKKSEIDWDLKTFAIYDLSKDCVTEMPPPMEFVHKSSP